MWQDEKVYLRHYACAAAFSGVYCGIVRSRGGQSGIQSNQNIGIQMTFNADTAALR